MMESVPLLRWQQRFQNFSQAFDTFKRITVRYKASPDDEITQMALAQAFEFITELAWKLLKDWLENEGFTVATPKETIRQAFRAGILPEKNTALWLEALKMRNLSSHTYNQETLQTLLTFINADFEQVAKQLYSYFQGIAAQHQTSSCGQQNPS